MKKSTRLLAVLLAFVFIFAGCTTPPDDNSQSDMPVLAQGEQSQARFILPYTNADGFNPFISGNNLTLQNSNLLFAKIIYITPDFEIKKGGCTSYSNQGLTFTINVDTEVKFADGSSITAQDVAQSLNAARQSTYYGGRFLNVSEVAVDGNSVVITLLSPDSMFEYLLDIPIMKADETASTTPTASGRYTYRTGGLTKSSHYNGTLPFDEIDFTELSGYDALSGSLAIGSISFFASENEDDFYGINVARQNYYRMNNLVFIGLNGSTWEGFINDGTEANFLRSAQGRKIINDLIDKQLIVEKAYYSRGIAASGAINPSYPNIFEKQVLSAAAQPDKLETQLTAMGYEKELDGFWQDKNGTPLSLRLLCYSGSAYKRYVASLVQTQLATHGIDVVLDEADSFEQYTQKIASGDFDMYIGEVKLYNNMDMSPFFIEGGKLRAFLQIDEPLITAYNNLRASFSTAAEFEKAFAEAMPYVPLLWRNGVVCYDKTYDGLVPSVSDVFYGLGEIKLDIEE